MSDFRSQRGLLKIMETANTHFPGLGTHFAKFSCLARTYTGEMDDWKILHNRFGHICQKELKKIRPDVNFPNRVLLSKLCHCQDASTSCSKRENGKGSKWEVGECVHMDLAGPFVDYLWEGNLQSGNFLDHESGYFRPVYLKHKSEHHAAYNCRPTTADQKH